MKEIDYYKLFWLFAGKDDYRKDLWQPFKKDGYYASTDGYSLIFMPIDNVVLDFPEQASPVFLKVVPTQLHDPIVVNILELESKLIPQMIDEEIEEKTEAECYDCNGCGEVEFEYESRRRTYYLDGECPVCKGKGKTSKSIMKPTGNKRPNEKTVFKIYGMTFYYKEIKRLIDACKILGVGTIEKISGEGYRAALFKSDNIKFLVMPCATRDEDEIITITT